VQAGYLAVMGHKHFGWQRRYGHRNKTDHRCMAFVCKDSHWRSWLNRNIQICNQKARFVPLRRCEPHPLMDWYYRSIQSNNQTEHNTQQLAEN
jgi:hypothetical protein